MAIKGLLSKIDLLKVKSSNGITYSQELLNAADLLRECIQRRINRETIGNMISSADFADIQVDGTKLSVTLKVENAIYPSVFYKWNHKRANVFWLLNDGFTVKNTDAFQKFHWKSHWLSRDGAEHWQHAKSHPEPYVAMHFVEKGIQDFNAKNKLGVEIKVNRPLLYYGL